MHNKQHTGQNLTDMHPFCNSQLKIKLHNENNQYGKHANKGGGQILRISFELLHHLIAFLNTKTKTLSFFRMDFNVDYSNTKIVEGRIPPSHI